MHIHEHLTNGIRVNMLSRKVSRSHNIFYKGFKEQLGITPLEYITRERKKLARHLLANEKNTVSQVSLLCGFSDVNYFVLAFKKSEGLTPGAYRLICRT